MIREFWCLSNLLFKVNIKYQEIYNFASIVLTPNQAKDELVTVNAK